DGNGYCAGKKGTDIPLVARIIGVADSYDTMSSDRCYRAALSKEKIISELKENAGTQFDPAIVPFMLAMIEDGTVPSKEDDGHLTLSAADE
ncbi:MAG: diguanylate cyclase, partial [Clostridia bacterium]|nr:diguanylate cyclase [Clostridia bacterium]